MRVGSLALVLLVVAAVLVGFLITSSRDDGAVVLRDGIQASAESGVRPQRDDAELLAATAPEEADAPEARSEVETKGEPAPPTARDIRMAPSALKAVLVLRVIELSGVPVPDYPVKLTWRGSKRNSSMSSSIDSKTDSEGYLRLDVEEYLSDTYTKRELVVRGAADGDDGSRGFRVALDEVVEPGVYDLGDYVLAPVPIIVAGIVQNPAGIPVPKALLHAWALDTEGKSTGSPFMVEGLRTKADGLFEMRGWAIGATTIRLEASHDAAPYNEPLRVPLGSVGVVVTLVGGGSIAGRVLLDELPPPTNLFAVAAPTKGNVTRVPLGPDGTMRIPKLLPQSYTTRLELGGEEVPLVSVDNIVVEAGKLTSPPEFNPFDLRGRLRSATVRLVDESGASVKGLVYYRASGVSDEAWHSQACLEGKPLTIVTASESLDLSARATGLRMTDAYDVVGDVTLVLKAGYPLQIEFPEKIKLPSNCTIVVSLDPRDDRRDNTASAWASSTATALASWSPRTPACMT